MKNKYRYNRKNALAPIHEVASKRGSTDLDVISSVNFINSAFDIYENRTQPRKCDFIFAIPTRITKSSNSYWDEAYKVIPAIQHLDRLRAFQVLSSLPPSVIETYGGDQSNIKGAIMFVPIFEDMVVDSKNMLLLRNKLRKRINDAAKLAYLNYDAKYLGLGAILPKLTNMGLSVKGDIKTSTGHAGTVWLMLRIIESIIYERFNNDWNKTIGFIGGGSIGSSCMDILLGQYGLEKVLIHDIRDEVNQSNFKRLSQKNINVEIANSNEMLIKESDIVVSAVTSRIPLKSINLSGKVILDDSQPGSFDRDEVKALGGELIWVVGRDGSDTKFLTRNNGYNFGDHGLHSVGDVWGCEAEIASLAYAKSEKTITGHVTMKEVNFIDEVFSLTNIEIANYQSYGKLN